MFVHKTPFTLQEHVKTTKTDKTRFFFAKKDVTRQKIAQLKSHFNQPNIEKKELCVDNIKTIGDVYCPACRNENCVYISTNKTTSFYDCKKCKACCHVLDIPFKDQSSTNMFFGGDGTHCLQKRVVATTKKKPSPFLKKFLRQSQPSTSELEPKQDKSSPNME